MKPEVFPCETSFKNTLSKEWVSSQDHWKVNYGIQSNLGITTTEGTGSKWSYFSGGLICQVWFKNFQYGVVHMPLREPWHQRSVAPTCKRGRYWQRPWEAELHVACKRNYRSFGVPTKEKLDKQKSAFAQFDVCGRFFQVESTLWADLWCPQFAFLRWWHFQERCLYIWIRKLKGLKLCVRNFQVVAFVRWSQDSFDCKRSYLPPGSSSVSKLKPTIWDGEAFLEIILTSPFFSWLFSSSSLLVSFVKQLSCALT